MSCFLFLPVGRLFIGCFFNLYFKIKRLNILLVIHASSITSYTLLCLSF